MVKRFVKRLREDKHLLVVLILFLIGLFLRFFRLPEFVTFLGDEGRDAIIIKRIITFEHFPAIGAPTSIGQVYLGPFYYYFIAPWLLIFNFNPVGLAFGVAFFASIFIPVNYFVVKDLINKKTALISTILVTFSATIIEFSRFSWNPNLLPLFSLLTVYFLIKSFNAKKKYFFLLAGSFMSFSIQLHYLALFLAPPLAIYTAQELYKNRTKIRQNLQGIMLAGGAFLFFSLPLLIFDFRHNFLNFRNFMTLSKTSGEIAQNKLGLILDSFFYLNKYTFNLEFNQILNYILFTLLIISLVLIYKKGGVINIITLVFIFGFLGVSLFAGRKIPHYYLILYPLYFIIIAHLLSNIANRTSGYILAGLFLTAYIAAQSTGYYFLTGRSSKQIDRARNIAQIIARNVTKNKFTVTSAPENYNDFPYRYFLELYGKKPTEKDSHEKTEELFVVCDKPCKPIGNSQWDIANFAPRYIIGEWKTNNTTIYKLTR